MHTKKHFYRCFRGLVLFLIFLLLVTNNPMAVRAMSGGKVHRSGDKVQRSGATHPAFEGAPPAPLDPTASKKIYLPLVSKSQAATIDIAIGTVEVTQGVQNGANTVPLVAGRPTVVRIYAFNNSGAGISNIKVTLSAQRNNNYLASSPLAVTGTVPVTYSRGDLNSSINVTLPGDWLSGQVKLTIQLDADNKVKETNEADNATTLLLTFNTVTPLNLKAVPLNYTNPGSGINYPAVGTTYLTNALLKLYPLASINRTVRATWNVGTCNLFHDNYGTCWDRILGDLYSLKTMDGSPWYQVYYGVIPLEDANGGCGIGGNSIIAGDAYLWTGSGMGRAAIGLADSKCLNNYSSNGPMIAAHEIGHTLGRAHAPCGGPAGVDQGYPYAGASIGQFGFNISNMTVVSPSAYTDIMGYCNPQWISDYTYYALYQALASTPGAAAADNPPSGAGLLVRARLDGDTVTELQPAYAINGYLESGDPNSGYRVEFLDANGKIVDSQPLKVLKSAEVNIAGGTISSLVKRPDAPFASYRIVYNGKPLVERDLSRSNPDERDKSRSTTQAATAQVSGGALVLRWPDAQTPAAVRYTSDGGQTYNTLAMDRLGGELSVLLSELPAGNVQFEIIPADQVDTPLTVSWDNVR